MSRYFTPTFNIWSDLISLLSYSTTFVLWTVSWLCVIYFTTSIFKTTYLIRPWKYHPSYQRSVSSRLGLWRGPGCESKSTYLRKLLVESLKPKKMKTYKDPPSKRVQHSSTLDRVSCTSSLPESIRSWPSIRRWTYNIDVISRYEDIKHLKSRHKRIHNSKQSLFVRKVIKRLFERKG